MAKNLTANFGANVEGFSAGITKAKQKLSELNTALYANKQAIASANKELKSLQVEQAKLAKEMKDNGTKEQKAQMQTYADAITRVNVKLGQLKTTEIELKSNIKSASSSLNEQKNSISSTAVETNKLNNSMSAFEATLKSLIAGYAGKKLWETLIGSNAELEQYETSFSVLLGSAERANTLVEDLKTLAINTPLELASTMANAQKLMAYGVSDNDMIDTMTKLGNLALGNADKMDRISLAYGQMLAKGKVTGEELRQIVEAGVPLSQALSKVMGIPISQLTNLIANGKVGIDVLKQAINDLTTGSGQFAGMMEKQTETLNGQLSILADKGANIARSIGTVAFEEVKESIEDINAEIDRMSENGELDDFAKDLGQTIGNVVIGLKNLAKWIYENKSAVLAVITALVTFKSAITIGNLVNAAVVSIQTLTGTLKSATTAQEAMNAVSAANPYVFIASAILSAAAAIGIFAATNSTATQSISQTAEELNSTAKSAQDEAQAISDATEKYQEIINSALSASEKKTELQEITDNLVDSYGAEYAALDLVNGAYDDNIAKLKELSTQALQTAQDEAQAALNAATSNAKNPQTGGVDLSTSGGYDGKVGTIPTEQQKVQKDANYKVYESLQDVNGLNSSINYDEQTYQFRVSGTAEENVKTYTQALEKIKALQSEATENEKAYYNEIFNAIVSQRDLEQKAIDEQIEAQQRLGEVNSRIESSTQDVSDTQQEQVKTLEELTTASKELVKSLDEVAKAYDEQLKNGSLSYDTVMSLIDAGYAAVLQIDDETGAVKLNTEAYKELAKAKVNAQIAELDTAIAKGTTITQAQMDAAYSSGNVSDIAYIGRQKAQESAANKPYELQKAALQTVINGLDGTFADTSKYDEAEDTYKTLVDDRIELINKELDAKKELRDFTIAAIDEEIQKRKELNEDTDMQEQIDAVNAQLKYSQLDEFSRSQLNKKLTDLKDEQAETVWQREMQDRKDAANETYETAEANAKSAQETLSDSVSTVKQIMDSLEQGITNISNIVNSNNSTTNNTTANVTLPAASMTIPQIVAALKQVLGTDVLMR